jgi:hypothetical protein
MATRSRQTSQDQPSASLLDNHLPDNDIGRRVLEMRDLFHRTQPKKPKAIDPNLQRDLQHGWLLPYLVSIDDMLYGRWNYWALCQLSVGQLPAEPIPQIDFCGHVEESPVTRKMLERCLDSIPQSGSWGGWSGWENVNYFLDWLLYGFGYNGQKELPKEPCAGASMRLYQLFQLETLLLWPYDYLGDMLAESRHGRGNGFYPTPHSVVELMVQMTFGDGDHRGETTMDCCLGTGRMLLHASNHSLRLYGQDVDSTVLKVALVNGYCYAPWMVKPIAWLDEKSAAICEYSQSGEVEKQEVAAQAAEQVSESFTAQAAPHYQEKLFDTEFDAEALPSTAPLLKRKPKAKASETGSVQTTLFD